MSGENCPVLSLLNTLSKRWVLHIIKSLSEGKEGFNDIKRSIPGISAKILTERLIELEGTGYILRKVTDGRPVKIRYEFTECGRSLNERVEYLNSWAREREGM